MAEDAIPVTYPLEHGPHDGETIILLHGGNMAGWTWDAQVKGVPDRHVLTPDLPGYGQRRNLTWPGTAEAADDIAERIRSRALNGRAHVVGLSLGGLVAVHLVHRHPQLVSTCIISGAAAAGYAWWERVVIGLQVPLWHRPWYWAAQARAFRIPKDERTTFASSASGTDRATNRAMVTDTTAGILPDGPFTYDGPFLAVAAEHDSASVRRAFEPLRIRLPQMITWEAPGMHHPWNIENPELFTRMVTTFADTATWNG